MSCVLRGEVEVEAFERAWQQVIARHAILRTAFVWRDLREPLQVVFAQVKFPLQVLDWRDLWDKPTGYLLLAPTTIRVERAITDWLINNDVTITDFNVVQARRVGANPCFVLNRSSLATEIRKRNQITFTTFATPGKCIFHEIASFLHIGGNMRLLNYESRRGLARL